MESPLVHVIQGIDLSCLVMLWSTMFVRIWLIFNNSFTFYQDCTVWTYSIDNWYRRGSTYSWYWRLRIKLGTTVQSGYSRHREKQEKYICLIWSEFKGHCILHKESENKFYYKCLLSSFMAANVCPVKDTIHMGYLPSIMSRYQVLFLRFYQDQDVVEVPNHAKKKTRPIYVLCHFDLTSLADTGFIYIIKNTSPFSFWTQ